MFDAFVVELVQNTKKKKKKGKKMPLFVLLVKCDLENIGSVQFPPETMWKLDIESESGERREGITVSRADELELAGSRGTANFVMKWDRNSTHQAYIKIVDVKGVSGRIAAESSGDFVPVVGFECRGLAPVRWIPGNDCSAESSAGKVFTEVDLSEGDWAEYDDENDLVVSITNIEHNFQRG